MQTFLTTLDDESRAVFRLRFAEGLSERDAAATLHVTRRRVRTVHERLLESLRAFLRPRDD